MTKMNLRNKSFVVALPFILALGAGCGGGGGSTITLSEFCSQKADKECAGVGAACVAMPSACKALRVAACEDFAAEQQQSPSSAARPFRPDKVADCLAKTAAAYSKAKITPADRAPMEIACARVFSGKKKDMDTDKSCTQNDYECDSSQVCDLGFMQCAVKSTVGSSANCNNPGETCPVGQFCSGNPRDCMPKLGVGQACDPTNPCLETLRCAAGTCTDKVALGGACGSDNDCLPAAPYCDKYNGSICVQGFTPSTGSKECVEAFGGVNTQGGTGGASGTGTGGATGADGP